MSGARALWFVWALVVFVALNLSAAPDPGIAVDVARQKAETHKAGLSNVLILLRDDGDTRRYFAYASAILGRPYDGYFLSADKDHARPDESAHVVVTPERPLVPWRDFTVEYPPGMLVFALAPALLTSSFPAYHLLFSLFMGLLLTATVVLAMKSAERIARGSGRDALLMSILFVAALGVISVRRYDAPVALALSAALYGLICRAPGLAGAGLGVGTVVKGAPILLASLGVLFQLRAGRWRDALASGGACGLVAIVGGAFYAWVAGDHAFATLAYHADRPIQIESLYGAGMLIANEFSPGLVHIVSSFGSDNIQSAWEPALRRLSTMAILLSWLGALAWFWRASGAATDETGRLRLLAAACTAMLIAFIGFGKVFSPQYLVWLLPSGAVAAALSSERSRVLLVASALATQLEYPFIYQLNVPYVLVLIGVTAIVRDGLLLSCAASLMADARAAAVKPGNR